MPKISWSRPSPFVGIIVWVSNFLAHHVTRGRVHGSAIAVLAGLALAYWGGMVTGKTKGLADLTLFGGLALMGGAMMRDFCIVATASEVHVDEARKAGWLGFIGLFLGTVLPFIVGVAVAMAFGYTDPVALTTIGAGAVTYIVGPVTGAAIGATSDVIALSIATGVVKAILVMVFTPFLAGFMKLDNPQAAMVFGGLAGTVSGVSAGLGGHRPAPGALRRPGRHVPYRAGLPDGPVGAVPGGPGDRRLIRTP